jgi:hypothetical protein
MCFHCKNADDKKNEGQTPKKRKRTHFLGVYASSCKRVLPMNSEE